MSHDYLSLLKDRLEGKEKFVPSSYGEKTKVKQLARVLGIRTPEVYFEGRIADLDFGSLPEEFVLKPTFASTNIGVRLIRRLEDGTLTDAISSVPLPEEQLRILCSEISARYYDGDGEKGVFIVEELLRADDGSTPPPDIRAFSFYGVVGMIQIESHVPGQVATSTYFDGNFRKFHDIDERYGIAENAAPPQAIDQTVSVPKLAEALITTAQRVSAAVPSAFCRVDMYEANGSIYLGEVTFYPGAFYYKNSKLMHEKEACRLGALWLDAQQRVERSCILNLN